MISFIVLLIGISYYAKDATITSMRKLDSNEVPLQDIIKEIKANYVTDTINEARNEIEFIKDNAIFRAKEELYEMMDENKLEITSFVKDITKDIIGEYRTQNEIESVVLESINRLKEKEMYMVIYIVDMITVENKAELEETFVEDKNENSSNIHIVVDIHNKKIEAEEDIYKAIGDEKDQFLLNMNKYIKEVVVGVVEDFFEITIKVENGEPCEDNKHCIKNHCVSGICRYKDYKAPQLDIINNIYYINLDSNGGRRKFMESWLSESGIPYQRVPASKGPLWDGKKDKRCSDEKSKKKQHPSVCRSIVGLRDSNIKIMDNYDVSGVTLVLEDDHFVNIPAVLEILPVLPSDWDIVRLDCQCWSNPPHFETKKLMKDINWDTTGKIKCKQGTIFQTKPICDKITKCWYCGGTHAVLWRSDKLHKLRKLWMLTPVDDIDCMLNTNKLKAYCVQGSVVSKNDYKRFSTTMIHVGSIP